MGGVSPPPAADEEEDVALEVELVEMTEVVESVVEGDESVEEPADVDVGGEVVVSMLESGGVVLDVFKETLDYFHTANPTPENIPHLLI